MTHIERAIKEAGGYWKPDEELYEGGIWDFNDGHYHLHHLLLTPLFWQALARAKGYGDDYAEEMNHALIHDLHSGKSAEEFFATL